MLVLGEKPNSLPKNKVVNQREMRHHLYIESYVNPISRAREYERILKEEALSQSQLAQKISVSRVRITQFLNLLKLPQEKQEYILNNGKAEMITERTLRKNLE